MSGKNEFNGPGIKPGSSATVLDGDVIVDIAAFCDCVSTAIDALKDCQAEQHTALLAELTALLTALEALKTCQAEQHTELLSELTAILNATNEGNTAIADLQSVIEQLKKCNTEENEAICKKLEALAAQLTAIAAAIAAQTLILSSIESNQTGMSCDLPTFVELCGVDVQECCDVPEGSVDYDRYCSQAGTYLDFTQPEGDECESFFTIGTTQVPLPNGSYTSTEALAALNAAGIGTFTLSTGQDGKPMLCSDTAGQGHCYRRICRREGQIVGTLTRICTVVSLIPAGEVECINFLRTYDKNSYPIAQSLANMESTLNDLLACCEDQNELAEVGVAKQCLMEDHLNPAGPCPAEVPPEGLNKEAQTLILKGDVVANYPEGQAVSLMNANGEPCGDATSAGVAVYNAETGQTTVTITECELEDGKTPAVITQAKPVTALVKTAIKTVQAFAIKKAVVTVKPVIEVTPLTPMRG